MITVLVFCLVVYVIYYIYYLIKAKIKGTSVAKAADPDFEKHQAERKAAAQQRKQAAFQRQYDKEHGIQDPNAPQIIYVKHVYPKKTHYLRNTILFGYWGTLYSAMVDHSNHKKFNHK